MGALLPNPRWGFAPDPIKPQHHLMKEKFPLSISKMEFKFSFFTQLAQWINYLTLIISGI
jgi:hypothetical protein